MVETYKSSKSGSPICLLAPKQEKKNWYLKSPGIIRAINNSVVWYGVSPVAQGAVAQILVNYLNVA